MATTTVAAAKESNEVEPRQQQQERINPSTQTFPFRKLPFEIRRKIYEFCLTDPCGIKLILKSTIDAPRGLRTGEEKLVRLNRGGAGRRRFKDYFYSIQSALSTSILLTSYATYQEASPVLYESNVFRFSGERQWLALELFEQHLTRISKNSIRKVGCDLP